MSKVRACVRDHYNWPTPGERQTYVDRLLEGDLFLMEDESAVCLSTLVHMVANNGTARESDVHGAYSRQVHRQDILWWQGMVTSEEGQFETLF